MRISNGISRPTSTPSSVTSAYNRNRKPPETEKAKNRIADEKPPTRPTISSMAMKRDTSARSRNRDSQLPMPMANR